MDWLVHVHARRRSAIARKCVFVIIIIIMYLNNTIRDLIPANLIHKK